MNNPTIENLIEKIDKNLRILEGKLKTQISPGEVTLLSKIPYKVLSIREIFLHRTFDFAVSSRLLFDNMRIVPAILLVRSIMETNAIIYRINALSVTAINSKDPTDLDNEAMIVLCGTRDPDELEYKSKNILSYIEKIQKSYSEYKYIYDTLSEFVHPNHDGCLGAYGKVDDKAKITYLGFDKEFNHFIHLETVRFLLLNLELFQEEYGKNEKLLPELIKVCDDDLKKHSI
jgi:hypothetical protein